MKIERRKNSIRNMFWGYINRLISIVCPFVIRTIVLMYLGTEYLGVSSLFTSILQVLSLAELGFSSAIVYSMYKPIANDDTDTICGLLYLYRKMYRIIGSVILGIGILLMPVLPYLISGSYPDSLNVYVLYLIYLGNSALSYFLFAYKSSLLQAFHRIDIESNISSILNTAMYLLQIVVLILFKNYYVYIIFLPISTLLSNLVRAYIVKKMFPQYECRGKLSNEFTNEIKVKVKSLFIYKVGNIVSNSVDNLVISSFLGLSVLAIYGNYYYIITSLFGILGIYYNSIRAGIGNSLVVESIEKNYSDFNKLLFLQGWIIGWCSICLSCLYQPFMKVWVKQDKFMLPLSVVIALSVYFYVWKIHDIVHTYKEALGFWDRDKYRPLIASILNLIINIILVQKVGVLGIVVSTILPELVITLPWAPTILYHDYFKRGVHEYLKRLLDYGLITIVSGIITYQCSAVINIGGIYELILKMCICTSIPNIIWVVSFSRSVEFLYVKSILRKKMCFSR